MGVEIDIEVDGVNDTARALKKGLVLGLKDAGDWTLDEGEDKAKDIILSADREWRKTLKRGFKSGRVGGMDIDTYRLDMDEWHGKIENEAPHAPIVEDGLKPGNAPPIQAILPWIDDKVIPNEEAQRKAEQSHIGNWDVQLQALAVQYGKAKVITSFAIKNKLGDEGYPGIGFMETTEKYLQKTAPIVFRSKIQSHMKKELKKKYITS